MTGPPTSSLLTPDLRNRLHRHGLRGPAGDDDDDAAASSFTSDLATLRAALAAALADRDRLESEVASANLLARARGRRAEAAEAALLEGGKGGDGGLDLRALEERLAAETARADAADAARAELEARVVAATPAVVFAPASTDVATWTGEDGSAECEPSRSALHLTALEAALDAERRAAAAARVDAAAASAAADAARVDAAHWRREVGTAVAAARLECALESAAQLEERVVVRRPAPREEAGVQTEVTSALDPCCCDPPSNASPSPFSRAASPEARPLRVRQQAADRGLASSSSCAALPSAASALAGLRALAGGAARLSAGVERGGRE